MGLRLDWEIEAESTVIRGRGEDPDAARRRRAARFRLLVTVALAALIVGGVAGALLYRWNQVNRQIETLLRDTVAAEVTALRIGDWNAFARIQRSATEDWINEQRRRFDEYQRLLETNPSAQLTGHILNVTIDGQRARVQVQEIIDGVAYARTWFYWRYDADFDGDGEIDGWRHVPPDPTFWGEAATFTGDRVRIDYRQMDAELATMMGRYFDEWLTLACDTLACDDLPTIQVDILSDGVTGIDWSPDDPWRLRLLSPYMDRARTDMPFDPGLRVQASNLLAERLMTHVRGGWAVNETADAAFLRDSTKNWLVGRFLRVDPQTHLITSLVEHYDASALGLLLRLLTPDASIDVLSVVTGRPLDQAGLDWRDFFDWRLTLERQLIEQQNSERFLALYDTRDEIVRGVAAARFGAAPSDEPLRVIHAEALPSAADGTPQRAAIVRIGEGETQREAQITFRLVNGVWLRAS